MQYLHLKMSLQYVRLFIKPAGWCWGQLGGGLVRFPVPDLDQGVVLEPPWRHGDMRTTQSFWIPARELLSYSEKLYPELHLYPQNMDAFNIVFCVFIEGSCAVIFKSQTLFLKLITKKFNPLCLPPATHRQPPSTISSVSFSLFAATISSNINMP